MIHFCTKKCGFRDSAHRYTMSKERELIMDEAWFKKSSPPENPLANKSKSPAQLAALAYKDEMPTNVEDAAYITTTGALLPKKAKYRAFQLFPDKPNLPATPHEPGSAHEELLKAGFIGLNDEKNKEAVEIVIYPKEQQINHLKEFIKRLNARGLNTLKVFIPGKAQEIIARPSYEKVMDVISKHLSQGDKKTSFREAVTGIQWDSFDA